MEYCKTSELKKLIPWEFGIVRLERMTGINARQWYKIKNLETYQSTEEFADKVLSALGTPHLYQYLEFTDIKDTHGHGITGYKKKGCRCMVCVMANRTAVSRYEAKKRNAKLKA